MCTIFAHSLIISSPAVSFLIEFVKLRKTTESFVMSVLSICVQQLCYHSMDSNQIWHFKIFRKSVEKIKISLISHNSNGYFTRRHLHVYDNISSNFSSNKKCFRQIFYILSKHKFYVHRRFYEDRTVYWILWNIFCTAGRAADDNTIGRMRLNSG
jgi:hypothetical protein